MRNYKAPAIKVKNEYNVEVWYNGAVDLMDDEIRENLYDTITPCTEQEFFNAYCKAHLEKYGEEFELAKENPCY